MYVLDRVENVVRKGENVGYQHFLLFSQCFQKAFLSKVVKSRDCVGKSRGVVKTMRENEKMLVTRIFSIAHNILNWPLF